MRANPDNNVYFLADEESFGSRVLERYNDHVNGLRSSNRHDRMLRCWRAYFGRSSDGRWDTSVIEAGGRKGENRLVKPNEFRNLLLHMKSMATSAPPAYDPQAINNDAESMHAAQLSTGLLDYYAEEKQLAKKRGERAEVALVFGESWQLALWDPNEGEVYAATDDPARPAREGDFVIHTLDPYDFAYDPATPDRDNPCWLIARVPKNRWNLAALFPDHADTIRNLKGYSRVAKEYDYLTAEYPEEDYVPIHYVFAPQSPALPDGVQAAILEDGDQEPVVLFKGPLEYRRVPGVRCAPEEVLKEAGGYTPAFDLLAPHEANAALVSTITSNQTNLGGAMIHIQRGSGITTQDLGSFKTLETQAGYEPKPLNLLNTPPELFTMLDYWQSTMERLGVVSAAVRGDVNATKGDSGKKAALIHAASAQFSQGFQGALRHGDATLATHMIHTLQTHARTERVTTISGKRNASASRSFTGKDLLPINRVVVRPANPYRDTQEGRREYAEWLMNMQMIKSPDDLWEVLTTGRLEPLYEADLTRALNTRMENEILGDPTDNTPLFVSPFENHPLEIKEHAAVLDSPAARQDPAIVNKVRIHIDQHMAVWRGLPPDILMVIGIQPPPPPPPPGMTAGMMGPPPGPPANDNAAPEGQQGPPRPANDNSKPAEREDDLPTPAANPITGEAIDARPMTGGIANG